MPNKSAYQQQDLQILVVEDSPINQTVAREILTHAGFQVTIACQGEQAIEAVREKNFALILMDIQMPVMDGYTATREIRKLPNGRTLPIIAMTANAMRQDIEKCLAAGMNDQITKPINIEKTFATINKWLNAGQVPQPSATIAKISHDTVDLPDNIPGINLELGLLNCSQNLEFYLILLQKFISDYGNQALDIQHLIKQGEIEQALQSIHAIKGVSGNLGATALHNAAVHLEQSLRTDTQSKAEGRPSIDAKSQALVLAFEQLVTSTQQLSDLQMPTDYDQ